MMVFSMVIWMSLGHKLSHRYARCASEQLPAGFCFHTCPEQTLLFQLANLI